LAKRDADVQSPDYHEIQAVLGDAEGGPASAEAHGTLCGLMSVAGDDLPGAWIENTVADSGEQVSAAAADALSGLHAWTREVIEGDQMAFALLLPGDDTGLDLRTEALARWVQGFLYGLAVRGLRETESLPEPIGELVADFSQIGMASYDGGDDDEEAEAAFAELVEFVRVGVQFIFDELNPPAKDPAPAAQTRH
jgi:uncharacterized protein YgfB (UPF0149 family)